jgi:Sulfotransferase family
MGDFAVNVAVAYQIGAARGDYSTLSAMDIGQDELFAAFGQRINDLILDHREHLEAKRKTRCVELNLDPRWLEATSRAAGPKRRWVDGTPEYSLHIYGLRKLFPQARFVHLLRDVQAVVRSMINFHRSTGIQLVASEEDAYRYWIRTVTACLLAERAYGPTVVHRIPYRDLIKNPESTVRSLLDFLEEPYAERCLEPLELRINSSTIPADCETTGPPADPVVVAEAMRLSSEVEETAQPGEPSSAVAVEMERAFQQRVNYVGRLDSSPTRPRMSVAGCTEANRIE